MKGTERDKSKTEVCVNMESPQNYNRLSGKNDEPHIENKAEFRNPNTSIEKNCIIDEDKCGENRIWHGIPEERIINGNSIEMVVDNRTAEKTEQTSNNYECQSGLQTTTFLLRKEEKLDDFSDQNVPITPEIAKKMIRCTEVIDKDQALGESKSFSVTPSTSRCTDLSMSTPIGKLQPTAVLPDCILQVNKTKEEEISSCNDHSSDISPRNDSIFANSDDSLSSDNMSSISNKCISTKNLIECSNNETLTNKDIVPDDKHLSNNDIEPVPSTSYGLRSQYSNLCGNNPTSNIRHENVNSESSRSMRMQPVKMPTSDILPNTNIKGNNLAHSEQISQICEEQICIPKPKETETVFFCKMNSTDYDDDTCVDCDEVDEEICTCFNYFNDAKFCLNEELSKAIDITNYIHTVSESCSKENIIETQSLRKRKLLDVHPHESPSNCSIGRKRIALGSDPHKRTPVQIEKNVQIERRFTPRSLIPTKDNPPPELESWITQFQRWSHVERLVAVDKLIENCEPTQVRHMMKVIEPQFQRDFISLLPKELALQVLSYLDPRDLLRAAQTCRSWRFLCDDNLLWKEKCKQAQILAEPNSDKPRRGRAGNMPAISSPWKAAFLRQHIIELNWRSTPIRQPKILKGHDDHVITCLQFYGNRIVSGSDDNTLKVWSAVSGKCLRTLVGHTGGVWSSQMAGNIIISGSTDRTLKVWNMDTGQCIHTLQGHTSTVRCMHLHGKKVVSGSRDATLRVWDIESGTCLHVLVGHLAAVRCVQYDGKLIVSGAYDYMVKVWNPERQECLHTLQGHTNRVYSLQFDGLHIVSGSLDTSIRVWDAETGSCKHTLMGHQSLTSGMELRQNILVSGNADSTVKVWDITSGQCLQTLSGPNKHQSAVTCLQFNSRFVITSSDDGTVKLWDVKTGDFIRNLVSLDSGGSGGVVWRIRASDTKLICAVGSRNGTEETKLMVLDFDVDGACAKCC